MSTHNFKKKSLIDLSLLTAGLCAVERANSHFRYWSYRRKIGNPISITVPLRQWPRRFIFELRGTGQGA